MKRLESTRVPLRPAMLIATAFTTTLVACAGNDDASRSQDSTGNERPATSAAPHASQTSVGATSEPSTSTSAGATDEPAPSPNVSIPERLACSVAGDCVLTTFLSCCSHPACEEDAYAVARTWLAEAQEPCAVVECQGSGERAPCIREGTAPSAVACVRGRCQISAY